MLVCAEVSYSVRRARGTRVTLLKCKSYTCYWRVTTSVFFSNFQQFGFFEFYVLGLGCYGGEGEGLKAFWIVR